MTLEPLYYNYHDNAAILYDGVIFSMKVDWSIPGLIFSMKVDWSIPGLIKKRGNMHEVTKDASQSHRCI